jgi:alanine racemase
VRLGIVIYGYGALQADMRIRTSPILQWKCRVMQVKSVPTGTPVGYYGTHETRGATRIAVLAAGYADGYLRRLSNRAYVLIRGRRCPVIGRVSMNWITVDVGADSDVQAGDEAVLIGRQGNEELWANDLAKFCQTIPYEILTSIKPGLERRYLG